MAKSKVASIAKAQVASEFWAWAQANPRDYIQLFCKVINKRGEKVNFNLNAQQDIVYDIFLETIRAWLPIRLAILKYRQPGISKFMGVVVHSRTVPYENRTAVITAHRKKAAEKNLRLQKNHVGNLPANLRPSLDISNKEEVVILDRNATISCNSANDPGSLRGDTVHDWILTEAAYYGEQGASLGDVLDAGMQQVPELFGTLIALETTANGTADGFYDFYQAADNRRPGEILGANGFRAVFLYFGNDPECQRPFHGMPHEAPGCYWFDHPEAKTWDEARALRNSCSICRKERAKWAATFCVGYIKERMVKYKWDYEQAHWYWYTLERRLRGDKLRMQQEYPCDSNEAFIASGTPLFDAEILKMVIEYCRPGKLYDLPMQRCTWDELTENEQLRRNSETYLEVWREPSNQRSYLIAADSSLGDGKSDPACAYVIDADDGEVCATIHGQIEPDYYGEVLTWIGYLYNVALLVPEVESMGHAVLASINRENYPNVYQRYDLKPEGWIQSNQLGFSTNRKTKPQLIACGRKYFNTIISKSTAQNIARKIKDVQLIYELQKYTTGHLSLAGAGAKRGSHDDRCMAWFISQLAYHQEQGIDIGEAASVSKEAADGKEYEKQLDRSRVKTSNVTHAEHKRLQKLYAAGVELEDIDSIDIVSIDDYDDDYGDY